MKEDITAGCNAHISCGVAGASRESCDEESFNAADTYEVSDEED